MSDETKKPDTPAAPAGGSEKVLAQEDVDAIVERRLARERTKHEAALATEKAEAEKAKAELAATVEKLNQLNTQTQTAEERGKLIDDIHAGLLAEIPEDKRGLIPEKLSKEDQIRYIQKNKAALYAVGKPVEPAAPAVGLPKSDARPDLTKVEGVPSQYKSLADWARRDRKAYLEWAAKNPPQ